MELLIILKIVGGIVAILVSLLGLIWMVHELIEAITYGGLEIADLAGLVAVVICGIATMLLIMAIGLHLLGVV